VSDPPPLDVKKLYRVKLSRIAGGRSHLVVREVPALAESLVEGDVYVLDKGEHILQLNTKASAGQEKFKAAEFAQSLISERQSQSAITVFGKIWVKDQICMHGLMDSFLSFVTDEGTSGEFKFFDEFGDNVSLRKAESAAFDLGEVYPILYRISDSSGSLTFEIIQPPTRASLSSQDAFLFDHSTNASHPAIYVWIGKEASLNERHLAVQYAQRFLYDKKVKTDSNNVRVAIPVIKMLEGEETPDFLEVMPGW